MVSETRYIFLSSTFADMQYERDYISKISVPYLNKKLAHKGIQLKIIDLRWGIDTTSMDEGQRDRQVLKVCLDEINRCRPFFIGLLGHRYGWVPQSSLWNNFLRHLPEGARQSWAQHPQSVTAAEIHFGGLDNAESMQRSFFFFRESSSYEGLNSARLASYVSSGDDALELEELKAEIRRKMSQEGLTSHLAKYSIDIARAEGSRDMLIAKSFGDIFEETILRPVEEAPSEENDSSSTDPLLEQYVASECASFFGRDALLTHIEQIIRRKPGIVVLQGESGFGKSAVFCKIFHRFREQEKSALVLGYSAGISPEHSNTEDMLKRWGGLSSIKDALDRGREVYLFIDSIDRFERTLESRYLSFLDERAHVFISALPKEAKEFRTYHFDATFVSLPDFSSEDAGLLISAEMTSSGKHYPEVEKALLKKGTAFFHAHRSPLWIHLACQVLFTLDADDFIQISDEEGNDGEKINRYLLKLVSELPLTPNDLFAFLFNRASNNFGEAFSREFLTLIAISWPGINLTDMEIIMGEKWDPLRAALLMRLFSRSITENGPRRYLHFSHSVYADAAGKLLDYNEKKVLHERIALSHSTYDYNERLYHFLRAENTSGVLDNLVAPNLPAILGSFLADNPGKNIQSFSDLFFFPEGDVFEKTKTVYILERWLYRANDIRNEMSRYGVDQDYMTLFERLITRCSEYCNTSPDMKTVGQENDETISFESDYGLYFKRQYQLLVNKIQQEKTQSSRYRAEAMQLMQAISTQLPIDVRLKPLYYMVKHLWAHSWSGTSEHPIELMALAWEINAEDGDTRQRLATIIDDCIIHTFRHYDVYGGASTAELESLYDRSMELNPSSICQAQMLSILVATRANAEIPYLSYARILATLCLTERKEHPDETTLTNALSIAWCSIISSKESTTEERNRAAEGIISFIEAFAEEESCPVELFNFAFAFRKSEGLLSEDIRLRIISAFIILLARLEPHQRDIYIHRYIRDMLFDMVISPTMPQAILSGFNQSMEVYLHALHRRLAQNGLPECKNLGYSLLSSPKDKAVYLCIYAMLYSVACKASDSSESEELAPWLRIALEKMRLFDSRNRAFESDFKDTMCLAEAIRNLSSST